jgi:hypothetical protein
MITAILSQDKDVIIYRKELNKLTGSVTATILLSQMIYWWHKNGQKEFYKFRTKCEHPDYKEGDSWCEELGFTPKELDYAMAAICEKKTKTKEGAKETLKDNLIKPYVIARIDISRKTYYTLNIELIESDLKSLYSEIGNLRNGDYENYETEITKTTKRRFVYTTENTTENSLSNFQKNENSPLNSFSVESQEEKKEKEKSPAKKEKEKKEPTIYPLIVEAFCQFYLDRQKIKYEFVGKRDGKLMKDIINLLKKKYEEVANIKEPTDKNLLDLFIKILREAQEKEWNYLHEINIPTLLKNFNGFLSAIMRKKAQTTKHTNSAEITPPEPKRLPFGGKKLT